MSAWVAGLFGLAGVLIGGTLNAGLNTLGNRRRDARMKRSSARLVLVELDTIRAVASSSANAGFYGPEIGEGFPQAEWTVNRAVLADLMEADEWQDVALVYSMCARLQLGLQIHFGDAIPTVGGEYLDKADAQMYKDIAGAATIACEVLRSSLRPAVRRTHRMRLGARRRSA